jgi:hypothetical protein
MQLPNPRNTESTSLRALAHATASTLSGCTRKNIPSDHKGVMGVPVSFLDKYSPEQFGILGASDNGAVDDKYKLPHFKKHNEPYVNGQKQYKRIFIKHKK